MDIQLYKINQELIEGCKYNSLIKVKKCLKLGAEIHHDENNALRIASYNGYLDIVQYLIKQGADIKAKEYASFKESIYHDKEDVFLYLVKKLDNDINISNLFTECLMTASDNQNLNLTKFLINEGVDIRSNNDYALKNSLKLDNINLTIYLIENYEITKEIMEDINNLIENNKKYKEKMFNSGVNALTILSQKTKKNHEAINSWWSGYFNKCLLNRELNKHLNTKLIKKINKKIKL